MPCIALGGGGTGLVIYGANFYGKKAAFYLAKNANIIAFCDIDKEKQNTKLFEKPIISPQELIEKYTDYNVVITIFNNNIAQNAKRDLIHAGFPENKIKIFSEMIDHTDTFKVLPNQYFDKEIVQPLSEGDVVVDAGCHDFANSMDAVKWSGNNYKKIIAFEPNPQQYPICRENSKNVRNAEVHPMALWYKNTEMRFLNADNAYSGHLTASLKDSSVIKAVALDSFLKGAEVSFIKMDIEGAELNALKGAAETILKYRPRLAICIYHKPEDVWEIPAYILSLHSDYKLFIRHYRNQSWETVLYAV